MLTRYRSAFYGPVAFGTSARSTLTDWLAGHRPGSSTGRTAPTSRGGSHTDVFDPRAALVHENDYKGYLEDRRPNSQGDPYAIASQILKTVAEVPTAAKSAAA